MLPRHLSSLKHSDYTLSHKLNIPKQTRPTLCKSKTFLTDYRHSLFIYDQERDANRLAALEAGELQHLWPQICWPLKFQRLVSILHWNNDFLCETGTHTWRYAHKQQLHTHTHADQCYLEISAWTARRVTEWNDPKLEAEQLSSGRTNYVEKQSVLCNIHTHPHTNVCSDANL